VAAGAIGVSNAVGAAITNSRLLGPAEAKSMMGAGLLLTALAVIAVLWPRVITVPLAMICVWVAFALMVRAYRLRRDAQKPEEEPLPFPARESEPAIGNDAIRQDRKP
jgi:cardiolipin synthase